MSTLHVENLKGLSSGGNANKIIVPSGQTLIAPDHVIQAKCVEWDTAYTHNSSSTVDLMSGQITIQQGSKIIAMVSIGRYVNGSGVWGKSYEMKLYVGNTLIQDTEHVGPNSTGEEAFQHNLMGQTEALNAGTYTIKITGNQIVSTNAHQFNRSPRSSWLIMQEVSS